MPSRIAVTSSHEVAEWFRERSEAEGRMLDGLRLQRLLFLAQAHFAAISGGNKLMPSVFVSSDRGPIEPNFLKDESGADQRADVVAIREPIVAYLKGIWHHYGDAEPKRLDVVAADSAAARKAAAAGANTEISVETMAEAFADAPENPDLLSRLRGANVAPAARTAIPRFHRGKPVARWNPGMKRPDATGPEDD